MSQRASLLRRWIYRLAIVTGVFLVASQFVPVDRSNPAADPAKAIDATENLPIAVKQVFARSCNNCHSNQTAWPWYSYVAPVSWLISRDVQHARKKMNFSEWGSYTAKKREENLEDICEQMTDGDMPDGKYALLHREARITQEDRAAVCQWTEDSRQY
jgi:hypothetical protein